MRHFTYSALSAAGNVVRGELVEADVEAVIDRLHAQALLPIEASEKQDQTGSVPLLRFGGRTTLPSRELALLSQQLARLLKAGLPLDRSLDILVTLSGGKGRSGQVMRHVLDDVRDGASLAEALERRKAFPPTYVSMVRAGEASGALHGVLDRLAGFLVRSEAIRHRVISAMIYPALLTVAAVLSVGMVLLVVLPQFGPVFEEAGARLPTSTRVLMAASNDLQSFWWAIPLGCLTLAFGWQQILRQPGMALRRDRVMLVLPVVRGLVVRFEVGRFARTMGTLLANGVAAPNALALCGRVVGNRAMADAIENAATRFKEGEGLSEPLARTGRFPLLSTQLVRIGEETGRLEEMLEQVADIYDEEVQRMLDRLLALLVPGITVVMGLVIAVIIASVMTALVSINDLAA